MRMLTLGARASLPAWRAKHADSLTPQPDLEIRASPYSRFALMAGRDARAPRGKLRPSERHGGAAGEGRKSVEGACLTPDRRELKMKGNILL